MIFTEVEEFVKNFTGGEILGVDLGSSKTGISVSILERKMAVSWCVIYEKNQQILCEKIIKMMQEKNCTAVVLGFPFAWEEGASAKRIMNFANLLSEKNCMVLLYDENRTSVAVRQTAFETRGKMTKKEMQNYDAKVASLILQNALENIKIFF